MLVRVFFLPMVTSSCSFDVFFKVPIFKMSPIPQPHKPDSLGLALLVGLALLPRLLGGGAAGLGPADEIRRARRVPPEGPPEAARLLRGAADAAGGHRRLGRTRFAQVQGHSA